MIKNLIFFTDNQIFAQIHQNVSCYKYKYMLINEIEHAGLLFL